VEATLEQLKFPVGKFQAPEIFTTDLLQQNMQELATLPQKLKDAVAGWSEEQLDTPYRPGGWTIRQVIHHLADSHMNGLSRIKLALTEENPTVKPYHEDLWAELADSKLMPVEPALQIIEGVHAKWVMLLQHIHGEQWQRVFTHPQHGKTFTIAYQTAMYAWHGKHHLAHITQLKSRMGW
jgi:hypothetical protein